MGKTIKEQIDELQKAMDEAFIKADAAKEAEDFEEADKWYNLAYGYESRMNRRKEFLQR